MDAIARRRARVVDEKIEPAELRRQRSDRLRDRSEISAIEFQSRHGRPKLYFEFGREDPAARPYRGEAESWRYQLSLDGCMTSASLLSLLRHAVATIDGQCDTGDIAGPVREEPDDGVGDLLGPRDPAEGVAASCARTEQVWLGCGSSLRKRGGTASEASGRVRPCDVQTVELQQQSALTG
jgi:hypothetical protein